MEKIKIVFDFLKRKGVEIASGSGQDIIDGNLKVTVDLIFAIHKKFGNDEFLLWLWCQHKTKSYKNVQIENFHASFKDGLAFCALIHSHKPELINYSKLSKTNPINNLNLAFAIAEKYFNIKPILNAYEIENCENPNENEIKEYLSCYFKAFN